MSLKRTLPIYKAREVVEGLDLGKAEQSIRSLEDGQEWRSGGAGAVAAYRTKEGGQVTVLGLGSRPPGVGVAKARITYPETLEEKVESILRKSKEG